MVNIMKNKYFGLNYLKNNDITLEKGQIVSWFEHCHMYNEFLLYMPFDGYITINEKVIRTDKPLAVIITPVNFHSIKVNGDTNNFFHKISFQSSNLRSEIITKIKSPIIYYDVDEFFIKLVEKLFEANESVYVNAYLRVVLTELIKNGEKANPVDKKGKCGLVADVLDFLSENFTRDITLNSVAKRFNVTPQYLSSVFKKSNSITFIKQLTDMRLKYAASLLTDENLNVTETCFACGYNNISNFIRAFTRYYGVSPKNFKNRKV